MHNTNNTKIFPPKNIFFRIMRRSRSYFLVDKTGVLWGCFPNYKSAKKNMNVIKKWNIDILKKRGTFTFEELKEYDKSSHNKNS